MSGIWCRGRLERSRRARRKKWLKTYRERVYKLLAVRLVIKQRRLNSMEEKLLIELLPEELEVERESLVPT